MPTEDRKGTAAKFTDFIERLTACLPYITTAHKEWVENEVRFITLELLSVIGRTIDFPAIIKGLERRDYPSLNALRAALSAAERDVKESLREPAAAEEVLACIRQTTRKVAWLEEARSDERREEHIGRTLAVEVEPQIQTILSYFSRYEIRPSHLRRCVCEKILKTDRLLEFLQLGIRNEVLLLGPLPQAPVPIERVSGSNNRKPLARTYANYLTTPRPERLARIDEPDPTPDGNAMLGLALILSIPERASSIEPPPSDQMLPFTLYKISSITERLYGCKSSVITGCLRIRTLRWTLFAKHFVKEQARELDLERLIFALLDLARDARWRVIYGHG